MTGGWVRVTCAVRTILSSAGYMVLVAAIAVAVSVVSLMSIAQIRWPPRSPSDGLEA